MKHSPRVKFYKKPLAASITAALLVLTAPQTLAENFKLGEFDISFDSTFSLGSSWRVENRNWSDNVGIANNVNNGFDFSNYNAALNPNPSSAVIWQGEGRYSTNGDNGNLNFDAGDAYSTIFKGTHELDIKYGDFGVFVRGMYFYDFEMSDSDRAWTNPTSGQRFDPCRDSTASDQVCSDIRFLDAFVYGDTTIGDMPFAFRVGQQVISWGESTLISHGISELNPVDISRLKAPGAELKEAFIPFGAVWASIGITENFSVEAFYQYQWEKTVLPAPGSYFSTNDFAGAGGHYNSVQLGFSGNPDMDLDFLVSSLNGLGDMVRAGQVSAAQAGAMYLAYPTKLTLRAPGEEAENLPEDGGQYGLRLTWFLPEFNDTELSLYYMNYHSRRPVFSGKTADYSSATIAGDVGMIASGEITTENYTQLNSFSQVELDYVEDIQAYAMSFNTTFGETAVAGEFTYRQDEPLQIDDVELLFAAMPQQLANAGLRPDLNGISQMPIYGPGETAQGYILADTFQSQMTFTNLWGPTMGASQFTTLLEVGSIKINNMPSQSELRLNGPGTARNGGIEGKEGLELGIQNGIETNPFPTDFAWGYAAVAKLDYSNVFASVNVSPRIVFTHDVNGITPDPLFMFVEDRKSVAIGIDFEYQYQWTASFGYSSFFGGEGTTNELMDRDFVSFSIKYSI